MSRQILTNLDMNSVAKIINLPSPSASGDAANKAYVDSAIEGLAWKDSCRVATQSNTNLASPGATLDGITMVANDRVLVRAQTTGSQNGIYVWNGAAIPMTRAFDAVTSNGLEQAIVTVEEGTSAGSTFRQTSINFTIDSGTVTFVTFGTFAPSATETTAGIAEIATQAETDSGTDDLRFVTPLKLATWANRKLKLSQDIGDGSATAYTITHNFNTYDVNVNVFRNSGNRDDILCDIERTTLNAVRLTFASAPSSNQFHAVVLG